MNTISEKEAFNKMAAYCSKGEHCTFEVLEKLKKLNMDDHAIELIINKLEKEKYIDNDRYCKAFINDKVRFGKWGKLKITQALYQKGIDKDIIRENLKDIDDEEYRKNLQRIIQNKKKDIRAKNDYEFRQKLIRSVMSKGFEPDEILRFIDIEQ